MKRSRRVAALWTALAVLCPGAIIYTLADEPGTMQGAELDFCRLQPAFADEFDDLSVASRSIGTARWIAHTPWNGDFGDAVFTDPGGPDSPFSVRNGILSITAAKDATGRWRSGLLSAADGATSGFSQRYGYFEARLKLPGGPGLWPAFWLGTIERRDRKEPSMEVDVIEHYGHSPGQFSSALHVWRKDPVRDQAVTHRTDVPAGSLYDTFHTYGVAVRPDVITYYFDRRPIWQQPTPPEHAMPLTPIVNLALGSGFPIDRTPNPSVMQVDYIRAYAFEEANPGCSASEAGVETRSEGSPGIAPRGSKP